MEDLKAEWECFQAEVKELLKIATDQAAKTAEKSSDNVRGAIQMIDLLQASMSNHTSNTNSFKANIVKHQVNTKTELAKVLSEVESLNKQHENVNKALIKNQKDVTSLKSQLDETCNKLKEQQSETKQQRI